jgi:hypothetical protein
MTLPALPVTWSLDGFEFNVGPDAFGHSTNVDVPEWDNGPDPKPQFTERTEGHGAYFSPNYRAGKPMRIKGIGQAPTRTDREELRDRLSGLCLDAHTLYPLTCHNPHRGDDLSMWVSLYDVPVIRRLRDGVHVTIDIPVFSPTPWKFSEPNAAVSTTQRAAGIEGILWNGSPAASGGIEYDGSPAVSGGWIYEAGAGATGSMRLTNSGNREAPITFTITSEALNPMLVAVQTQQRLRWTGLVSGSNYLLIDTETEQVSLGSDAEHRVNVNATLAESGFFMVPARSFIDVVYSHDTPGSSSQAIAVNSNVYS